MTRNHKQRHSVSSSRNVPYNSRSNGTVEGAKNTWNITIALKDRIAELEVELDRIKCDVIGLSESRLRGEANITLQSGYKLYQKGYVNSSLRGVGILSHKRLVNNVISQKLFL